MRKIIKNVDEFVSKNLSFFNYLAKWEETLKEISFEEIISHAGSADSVALLSVDMIEGFTRIGPLASERIEGIIKPVVELFKKAELYKIKNIVLAQDNHH